MRNWILLAVFVGFLASCNCPQKKQQEETLVAFYNLENLFDTIDAPEVMDEEFLPEGKKKWDAEKYQRKIAHMSQVIADIGTKEGFEGPAIIGLCEVENKAVVEDLVASANLKSRNYSIVHYDSPDHRGIDVALLYKGDEFTLIDSDKFPLFIYDAETNERIFTRDQLLVNGVLMGDTIHLIVNHWPSRYGGEETSRPFRMAAAKLNRSIIDSLLSVNPMAKVITMGDLNDDPTNISLKEGLKTCCTVSEDSLAHGYFYNAMELMHQPDSIGTLMYRGRWNLFDQMIVTKGLVSESATGLRLESAHIFKKPYLIQQEGKYKGHLLRTFGGRTYLDGYSDHLPVYMLLKK